MSRKVFTAGEVLAAADVNSFLMDQTVMSFAGTAARGSAIPSPVTGMTTYLEDTKDLRIYDGSAWIAPNGMTHIRTETVPPSTSTVSLNNVFTSEFRNYQIVMNILGDTLGFSMAARMRLGGVDNTANSYSFQLLISAGTSGSNQRQEAVASSRIGGVSDLAWQSMVMSVNNPAIAQPTTGFVQNGYYIPFEQELSAYRHNVSTAYDGITFFGGPFRGTISVYGLR
jgi:hypothetical protein